MEEHTTELEMTTIMVTELDVEDYRLELADDIYDIAIPIITVFGLFGNGLTMCAMLRSRFQWSPVAVFLTALAVSDSLVLFLSFINNWLNSVANYDMLSFQGVCQIHRFLFDVAYTYSSWLVVCLAVERLIVVMWPLRARVICTRKTAKRCTILLPVIIGVVLSYNLTLWTVEDGSCSPRHHYDYFISVIAPWVTASLYSYIPVLIIIVCSIGICCKVCGAHKSRSELNAGRQYQTSSASDQALHVAVTTSVVCLAHLLFTMPVAIWYIYIFATRQFTEQENGKVALTESILIVYGTCNYSINFFLYVMTSAGFRHEVHEMLFCKNKTERIDVKRDTRQDAYTIG